jgi:hypothetical protein
VGWPDGRDEVASKVERTAVWWAGLDVQPWDASKAFETVETRAGDEMRGTKKKLAGIGLQDCAP